MLPNVAIIMSVYKSDNLNYFKESVESVLNQTYSNFTLFIWRDGVVPYEIDDYLNNLASNPRCVINLCSENNGLAKSLNRMIDIVIQDGNFDYIARMDSDDISYKDRIESQVEFLESNPSIDVIGGKCREFGASFALDEKSLPQNHDELVDFSIARCPFIHPTVMFRARVFLDKEIRYPTNTSLTEDMALWFLLLSKGFKFANINKVLLDYRLNEATLSRRRGLAKSFSEIKIRFYYMHVLNRYSFKNVSAVMARMIFHVMPIYLVRLAYRHAR
ncbi:glycosyltransferase [Vibrio anguillarum]|uniref:glycosyltransferase n=1 Tax=Vibrio anguillarum TaxID=55601 RepID=UPI00097E2107|nr:glycosyltransferase [Vibrio anguillarum]MBT2948512.1 glycosyltransferase [Vibrio anguillarum]